MSAPIVMHADVPVQPSRRAFLRNGALTVAFALSPLVTSMAQTPARAVLPGSLNTNRQLNAWLRINPQGSVTVMVGKVELGQGILTALTQIVADELDVAISRIELISGHTTLAPNEGVTSGSLSIQDSGTALRFACAQARSLLLEAAAQRLGLPVADLRVADGNITQASASATSPTSSYWAVTSEALIAGQRPLAVAG